MTYLQFHFVFTIPLFFLVLWLNRNNPKSFSKTGINGTLVLLFLAVSYTTPWDSYLIHQEIWTYSPDNITGSFLKIPFEEYFFFIIQTIIGCLFTSLVIFRSKTRSDHQLEISGKRIGLIIAGMTALFGLLAYLGLNPRMRYFNLVAFWALPIVALQWSLGWNVLMTQWRTWLGTIAILTAYFWVADSIAIYQKIWTFPAETISGVELFGILPIEEALFFLLTNTMVVQGYILFTTVDPHLLALFRE